METTQSEKLSISIPGEMAKWVREKVGTSAYSSNSEIVREGLRLLRNQEEFREKELTALRDMIEASLKSGKPIPAEKVFAELESHSHKRSR